MKKIYLPVFCLLFLNSGCSKDFLKRYEDRMVGTWRIADVNSIGFGGTAARPQFADGVFVFNTDGSLSYTDAAGNNFNGFWILEKRNVNDEIIRTLQLTAVDFASENVMGEFYDEVNFRGTDHFVTRVNTSLRSYVTHFRR